MKVIVSICVVGKLFVAPLTSATADNAVIPATLLNFSKAKADYTQGKSLCMWAFFKRTVELCVVFFSSFNFSQ